MSQIHVLFIDDEEELVAAWVERINLRGIQAEGVTSGNDALKVVEEKEFDVVVLDIRMPGMDGYTIMHAIKLKKPNIPIIMITGHQCTEEERKEKLYDAFDCLVKPVNFEVLIEKIKEAANKL